MTVYLIAMISALGLPEDAYDLLRRWIEHEHSRQLRRHRLHGGDRIEPMTLFMTAELLAFYAYLKRNRHEYLMQEQLAFLREITAIARELGPEPASDLRITAEVIVRVQSLGGATLRSLRGVRVRPPLSGKKTWRTTVLPTYVARADRAQGDRPGPIFLPERDCKILERANYAKHELAHALTHKVPPPVATRLGLHLLPSGHVEEAQ
jgi:hypothetical protein